MHIICFYGFKLDKIKCHVYLNIEQTELITESAKSFGLLFKSRMTVSLQDDNWLLLLSNNH